MQVWQLIEKLQELDQDATVNVYEGYDQEYGDYWNTSHIDVLQEIVDWDEFRDEPIFEVFIK